MSAVPQAGQGAPFPAELADRRQWLVWRFIVKPGQKKPSKMPYYATTGELRGWPLGKPRDGVPTEAQPQVEQGHELDRQHLVTFEEAAKLVGTHGRGFDGLGFAFLPGDGLVGIDLDDIENPERAARAQAIIEACGTWCEWSPSGKGVHIIGLGEIQTTKSDDIGVEVFCGRQFFTMTGQVHELSAARPLAIDPEVLAKISRTVEQAKEARRAARQPDQGGAGAALPGDTARPAAGSNPAPAATRYCMSALESAVQRMRGASEGGRNDLLNGEVYGLAQLVHTGGISEATIRGALRDAAIGAGLPPGEVDATIRSAMRAGLDAPRPIPERDPPRRPAAAPAPSAPRIDPDTGEILDDPEPPPYHANDNAPRAEQPPRPPLDVFAEFPAPPIEAAMLPDVLWGYAAECGELIGVEPAMVAIPALVSCAAALHDGVRIQPKRHETGWTESARLWCAIVGTPSVKKSPAIRRATKRLRKIDADLAHENASKAADYAEQMEQHKEAKKEAKKTGVSLPTPERPQMKRMIVEDITVEALSEVLKDNDRGVLCIQDELSGWFGSMDAYSGGKAGNKDRAAWLQAYNGGFRQVDRVLRGSVHIPNFSVSMIGGIQPDAIRRIAKDMTDDGLMQRFMVVIGRNAHEFDRHENDEVSRDFAALVDHLHRVQPGEDAVKLSEKAHEVREDLMAYANELAEYPALPGGLRSHLGKWSGLFARLLLVYHAIECAAASVHPCSRRVSGDCAAHVDALMRRFLLPHALAYYTDVLGASSDLEHARWVAGHVLSKGLDAISNRDLVQAYKQWRGLDDWRRQRVMQVLEDMSWLTPVVEEGKPSRRGATSWLVNPLVHTAFAQKAQDEAGRRDKIRSEIAAMQRRQ